MFWGASAGHGLERGPLEDRGWPGTPSPSPTPPQTLGEAGFPPSLLTDSFCDHRAPTWRTAHPGTPRRCV